MSEKFLDITGLRKYTAKLLNAIQSAVVTYVGGDGINIEDTMINVDNPMRGVFTQDEFDALPNEKKNSGTYFIKDANIVSGSSTFSVYDSEEHFIGSWFGKPLYRKCYSLTSPSVRNQETKMITLDDNAECIFMYGFLDDDLGARVVVPYYYPSYGIYFFCRNSAREIYMNVEYKEALSRPCKIVLEYIKTSDTVRTASVSQNYTTLTSDVPLDINLPGDLTVSIASATQAVSSASSGGLAL